MTINERKNLSIIDILEHSLSERKISRFNATRMGKISEVVIDSEVFTDYKAFSFIWEKSYVESPSRSEDGTIGNLNAHPTFVTPHLKMDFSLMSIDSYRRMMALLYEKNEFLVSCYDVVYNKVTTNKMYFATEEMPKLVSIARSLNGEQWVELLGVQDYTVELIGTNADIDLVDILYYDKDGILISEATQTVYKGTEAIIGYNYNPPAPYKFDGTWRTELNGNRANGEALLVNGELKLYANVSDENQYVLSFNYGLGNSLITQTAGELINIRIRKGETIGTAIQISNIPLAQGDLANFLVVGTGVPPVKYNGKTYEGSSVYSFLGWYWTQKDNSDTKVDGSTVYNYNSNRTIYQIYEIIKKTVSYNTNTDGAITIANDSVGYGEKVYLPTLAMEGYTHNGWYTTPDFKDGTAFSGTMPPYELTLYAKWVKN